MLAAAAVPAQFTRAADCRHRVVPGLSRHPKSRRNIARARHITLSCRPAFPLPRAIAGHTHGGQIRVPGRLLRRLWGWVDKERPQRSGRIESHGKPGNRLYINRGIGFSWIPLRFYAPPEITVFTLRRAR